MQDLQVEIHPARLGDIERIQQLQANARRTCERYGYEDLVRMVAKDYCFIADTGPLLWGVICATVRQQELALLRGLSLIDGWRVDSGVTKLMEPLVESLRRAGMRYLMHLAMESWLAQPLQRHGFDIQDYIVHFERAVPAQRQLPDHQAAGAHLRYLGAEEIGKLTDLDKQAFEWPWQFSSGELVQLLMTTSRLVVLECAGQLVGYACTDVQGDYAQIIRLAVHPKLQGQGFGRHLLADAMDFAQAQGAADISLNTQWQNQASQKLYKGFGFRTVGRRVPVMIKALDAA